MIKRTTIGFLMLTLGFTILSCHQNKLFKSGKNNEYSDERIIFKKPLGFSIERTTLGGEPIFRLTQVNKISIEIFSDSAADNVDIDTQEFFKAYMLGWTDIRYLDLEFDVMGEHHYIRNGNSIYLKIVRYRSEPIDWAFVLIVNKETSAYCLISSRSTININKIDFLTELINSIKFKKPYKQDL